MRSSMNRQPQKAIWRLAIVTRTITDRQNGHRSDRRSRVIVHRGIEMRWGSSRCPSIYVRIGCLWKNLKCPRPAVPGMPVEAYV